VYAVDIDEATWRRFERTAPNNVVQVARQVLSEFLSEHPEDREAAAGRLKKLKGRQAGLLQYDLPSFYRLIYRVDRERQVVTVEYIGAHPNW
jgi:mRNA-degrading endonuclease RelE of RelBE toxin-antitoxin system